MSEGCKWHKQRLGSQKWVAPPFEREDGTREKPAPKTIQGVEFVPTFDGQKWSLQQCSSCQPLPVVTDTEQQKSNAQAAQLEADMKYATQRFLDGFFSDESDA